MSQSGEIEIYIVVVELTTMTHLDDINTIQTQTITGILPPLTCIYKLQKPLLTTDVPRPVCAAPAVRLAADGEPHCIESVFL